VDQELEPKKRPSKERRGWQGEKNNIENAERELQLGRFFGLLGVLYLVLFALPTSPLFARAFLLGTKL